jgi:hypothetical protein
VRVVFTGIRVAAVGASRRKMKRCSRTATMFCLFVLIVAPNVAHAESFLLSSGSVDFQDYGLGSLQLISGTPPQVDFAFLGGLDAQRGGFFAPAACFTGHQSGQSCAAGTTMSLAANWSGSSLPGTALVHGVEYQNVGGSDPSDAQAGLALFGLITLPIGVPVPPAGREIDAPFTLTGFLDHSAPGGGVVHDDFIGQGTARVFLNAIAGGTWAVSGVLYDVTPSPTPEPMSALLLGSGLATLLIRRYTKHRSACV